MGMPKDTKVKQRLTLRVNADGTSTLIRKKTKMLTVAEEIARQQWTGSNQWKIWFDLYPLKTKISLNNHVLALKKEWVNVEGMNRYFSEMSA